MGSNVPWTPEAVALLRELYADKTLTFVTIAELMTAAGHPRTKNACIGQAHRMKLPLRSIRKFGFKPKKAKPMKSPLPRMPDIVTIVPEPRRTGRLQDFDLDQCRWPLGEIYASPPFLYCCDDKTPGSSYCRKHDKLAHPSRYKLEHTR